MSNQTTNTFVPTMTVEKKLDVLYTGLEGRVITEVFET